MPVNVLKCIYGNCVIQQRYVLCFMLFWGIFNAYCLRVSFNMALPAMVVRKIQNKTSDTCPDTRGPSHVKGGTYQWSQNIQSSLLLSFYATYVICHIPGGYLADVLGGKHIFGITLLIGAISNALTPLAVYVGDWWLLLITRLVQGACQGFLFPSATTLMAKWFPKRERATLGTLVYTGPQVGSIFGNLLTGLLIHELETWTVVFYFWALICAIWYVPFFIYCYSEPSKHPFLTTEEAEMLEREIGKTPKLKVPWKKLFLDPACLALTAGQIGHGAIFFILVTDLPKYMDEVLKFKIQENGFLNALPYCALWISGAISGVLSDYLINKGKVTIIFIRKFYTTIASVGPSVLCTAAIYMGCDRIAACTMFTLGMFTMGPFYPGMRVNALDITKNFAGVLTAFVNGVGALAFIPIQHALGEILQHDSTLQGWRLIFWIVFIICTVTNIIYVIWASGEQAEWDKVDVQAEEQ